MQAAASRSKNGHDAFKARLARIDARGANTIGKVYVGEGGSVPRAKAEAALRHSVSDRGRKSVRKVGFLGRIGGMLICAFLGGLAVLMVRFALFKLLGPVSPLADPMRLAGYEAGGAAGIALLLMIIAGTFKLRHWIGALAGLAAGLTLMHNAVHLYPDHFAVLFSPEWVAAITDTSIPRSAVFADRMLLF